MRPKNVITSLSLDPAKLEQHNFHLGKKYKRIADEQVRYKTYMTCDAETLLVAYGTCARIAHAAVDVARERGLRVGLFRPVSLWPFPYDALQQTAEGSLRVLTIEMSLGQMVEDVRLAILGAKPVHFYGRTGGMTPTPREVLDEIERIVEEGI